MTGELTVRRSFLLAYSERDMGRTLQEVAKAAGVDSPTLTAWLSDPAFRDELADLDLARAAIGREIYARHYAAIMENLVRMAVSGGGMVAIRAAEAGAKLAGFYREGTAVVQAVAGVQVNVTVEDVPKMLVKLSEVEAIAARHSLLKSKARQDAAQDGGVGSNGDHA